MKIAFFTNFISHHQVYVADELYRLTDGDYYFVELIKMPDSYRKTGYPDFTSRPYVLQAWRNNDCLKEAYKLAIDVDVMLVGSNIALPFEKYRCINTKKITFEVSERWFKRGLVNIMSPRFLAWYYHYLCYFRKKMVYKLCCSAFTSYDMSRIGAFKNKCFKWGYFTKIENFNVDTKVYYGTRIMWVSRFIGWKHPEMVIRLAKCIKDNVTASFHIDMYGGGELYDDLVELVDILGVQDLVSIHSNLPNEQIISEMRNHDIVLATSDQNEGWGAVVNEAMSNGCVLIGSDKTGSVPYLINDGENGFIFESGNMDSLYDKICVVLGKPEVCRQIAKKGYETMLNVWSPKNAAQNLLTLIYNLQSQQELDVKSGPCSKAEIIKI